MAKTDTKDPAETATPDVDEKATGTDVATASESNVSTLPEGMDAALAEQMLADAGDRQMFDADQLTIPRLALLQDLSPETKEYEGDFIPGAKPGMIVNKLFKTLDREILFVPAKFVVRYIAWKPRREGGGLVDQNLTRSECDQNFQKDGIGRWVGVMKPPSTGDKEKEAVKVEIIETPEWVGFAKSDSFDWSPVAISFPITKAKVCKDMNTVIELHKMEIQGQRITPASYYHLWKFGSFLDSSGDDKFFNFTAERRGYCLDEQVRADAKALKHSFEQGDVVVEDIETRT